MSVFEQSQEVYRIAQDLYGKTPDWVAFYREILGVYGVVRRMFPTRELLDEFEKSEAHEEIQRMLTKLRERGPLPADPDEPTRVITVRVPKSLHDALRVQADQHQTSINKLCISKLLQFVDGEMVPVRDPELARLHGNAQERRQEPSASSGQQPAEKSGRPEADL